MSNLYVPDSDEFDDDSLDETKVNSSDQSSFDLDEIPESPLAAVHGSDLANDDTDISSAPSKVSSIAMSIESTNKKQLTGKSSDNLPTIRVKRHQSCEERILDFRDIIQQKLSSKKFSSMKFKDFKQAKKTFKQSKSMADCQSNQMQSSKKIKIETDQSQFSGGSFVYQKMQEMKQTISALAERVNQLEQKIEQPPNRNPFINRRKSVFPDAKQITSSQENLVDSDDEPIEHQQMNDPDLSDYDEIPDSLENSIDEIPESDLEDENFIGMPSSSNIESNPSTNKFVRSRPTILPKEDHLYADETFPEDLGEDEEVLTMKPAVINETVFDNIADNNSSSSGSMSNDSLSNMETASSNNEAVLAPKSGDTSDLKLTLFRKKRNTNLASQYNHNVAGHTNSDDGPKMLHSAVRKKVDRKQLLAFICQDCQNYYATRDINEEQLKKLIQVCSRHRGHNSPYRSPSRFWEIDFPSSQEKIKDSRTPKKAASKLPFRNVNLRNNSQKSSRNVEMELYDDWENDIDSNSRDSNVLHSTRLE